MHDAIADHKLRNGEGMSTLRVLAPDKEYKDIILSLLAHKGTFWLDPIGEAMEGSITILKTYCYLAIVGGEAVGNITTLEALSEPVGILAHVFTKPAHRKKGIASFLMEDLLADFRARKGRALYLGTGYGSEAHRIYGRYGFKDLGDKTGKMRYLTREGFDAEYFGGSTADVVPTRWEHWPGTDALFSTEGTWFMKNMALGAYDVHGFEGSFISLMQGLRNGDVRDAKVLVSDGAVIGLASLVPDRRWNYGVTTLDFFVHPKFIGEASKLIRALEFGPEKAQCIVESTAHGKSQVLEECGFALEAVLKGQLRQSDRVLDVSIYSRRP